MRALNRTTNTFGPLLPLFIVLQTATELCAHEDLHTHPALSAGAMLFLDLTYPEDGVLFPGFGRSAIRQGSIEEDQCPKYVNHFYNPKTGLNAMDRRSPGCILQLMPYQTAPTRAAEFWAEGVSLYRAGDANGAFLRLGYVFHLLQDMTSPAHVHNDVHVEASLNSECQDGDDFENWGWRPTHCGGPGFTNIHEYVQEAGALSSWQLKAQLLTGLQTIFNNQPQTTSLGAGHPNIAYSFVHTLADKVYDFTTFQVRLTDTFNGNDPGSGELKNMFGSLEEAGVGSTGWWIGDVGYSEGLCEYQGALPPPNEAWWIMPGCLQWRENLGTVFIVEGGAYIENTGGGNEFSEVIPDTLRPAVYQREWFKRRYGSLNNTNTMLQIYGDVLYPAAVAYGAGLLQAFLDEAIMPKPITARPTQLTDATAQLNGQVRPPNESVSAWFQWGPNANYGNVTPAQETTKNPTNLTARIEGLTADSVYECRVVSSNRFGIRYGASQSFRTPAAGVTSGSIANPSFEADSFTNSPGYVFDNSPITGWTATGGAGLNPASGNPFADNGAVPHGNNVAFIQSGTASSLSSVISNLTIGRTYKVDFRVNARSSFGGTPNLKVSIDGVNVINTVVTPVGGSNPYKHCAFDFTATGTSQTMTLSNDLSGDHTVLVDDFHIGLRDSGWSYAAWNGDASSGVTNANIYTHAYKFGSSGSAEINGIVFTGVLDGNPVRYNQFTTVGLPTVFNNDSNNLTDAGSSQLARDFLWGGAEQSITIHGLTAGKSYVATIYSVGWENGARLATFSVGNDRLTVNQDEFGDDNGIRVSYNFTANSSLITLTYVPLRADTTFHTYGFSVYEIPPVVILASEVPQPGQFRIRFAASAGVYDVQRSIDLRNWATRGPAVAVSSGLFEFTDTDSPAPGAFYRVRSRMP